MRSETAPTWVGFAIGFGVALIVVAVFALAKGEMKVVSSVTFRRDTQPGAVLGRRHHLPPSSASRPSLTPSRISGRAGRMMAQDALDPSCRT